MAHIETFNDLHRADDFSDLDPKRGSQLPRCFLIARTGINANGDVSEALGLSVPTPVDGQGYTGVN